MILFLLTTLCFANESSLLFQATEGRLGLRVEIPIDAPSECIEVENMDVDTWRSCSILWKLWQEKHQNEVIGHVWAVVSDLRSNDISEAYNDFEPILASLSDKWNDDNWSLVILEAWLLAEMGAKKNVPSLLDSIPSSHPDYLGSKIVYLNWLNSNKKVRQRDKVWDRTVLEHSSPWLWWHKAHWTSRKDEREFSLFQATQMRATLPLHYHSYIEHLRLNKQFTSAFTFTLQGLSRFPDSKLLFRSALTLTRTEAGQIELESRLEDFPEHTKLHLIKGMRCFGTQELGCAWSHLVTAKGLGDRSLLIEPLLMKMYSKTPNNEKWDRLEEITLKALDTRWLDKLVLFCSSNDEKNEMCLQHMESLWGLTGDESLFEPAIQMAEMSNKVEIKLHWEVRRDSNLSP